MLQKAHQLMQAGNYVAAAEAFEELARRGEAMKHAKTGQMYLQAGRARLMAGQPEVGFAHLKHGLEYMARMGQHGQLFHAGNRAVAELNERGLTAQAQELATWLKTALPAAPAGVGAPAVPAAKPVLPTHCPGCGGPVRADDVEWLDDVTAECNWCGSPVRAG
jgi:hypothetical protein